MIKLKHLDVYNPSVVHPLIKDQIQYQAPEVLCHAYIQHQVIKITNLLESEGDTETLKAVNDSYQHLVQNYED